MTTKTDFIAEAGQTVDNEGFRIVTSGATMDAHVGEWATIWLPGRWCATSVSVFAHPDGMIEVGRDGKGDRLVIDTMLKGLMTMDVMRDGQLVAFLDSDGTDGRFYDFHAWHQGSEFTDLAEGLVRLAQTYLV